MTNQELIERLRRMSPRLDILDCENVLTASDRIEDLIAENKRLGQQCEGLMQAGMNNGQALIIAEAKLAKAVEALNAAKVYIDDLQSHEGAEGFSASTNQAAKNYHAALAELEGE